MALLDGYGYYRDITDGAATAARDVAVRVLLAEVGLDSTHVRADGADLLVYDVAAATALASWLEDFDPAAGTGTLFYRAADTTHATRLYYGNPDAQVASSFASVFDEGTGFDDDWGGLTTSTTEFGVARRLAASLGVYDPRHRQVFRRSAVANLPRTFGAGASCREVSIVCDPQGTIQPEPDGSWVAYFGSRRTPTTGPDTWRAVSRDRGVTWDAPAMVLPKTPGTYDGGQVMVGCVLRFGPSDYRMWYTATGDAGHPGGVALATSADNRTWTKRGLVISVASSQITAFDNAVSPSYAVTSVAVPRVRRMRDGNYVLVAETRPPAYPWFVHGWSSPDAATWTILNAGNPLVYGSPELDWIRVGAANPNIYEVPDGSGYLLYVNGQHEYRPEGPGIDPVASFDFSTGFLSNTEYGTTFTPDPQPVTGRAAVCFGEETSGWQVAPDGTWVVHMQDYPPIDTPPNNQHASIFRIYPVPDRGGLLVSPNPVDAAAAYMIVPPGTFAAESRSLLTTHRSMGGAAPYLLALIDASGSPGVAASGALSRLFRVGIRRLAFDADDKAGGIQLVYWDKDQLAHYWTGSAWGTTPTAAAGSDMLREVVATIGDDGFNYRLRVAYADDDATIAQATAAYRLVAPLGLGRTLVVGDPFTDQWAAGLFFRHIGIRPFVATEPQPQLGAEKVLGGAPPPPPVIEATQAIRAFWEQSGLAPLFSDGILWPGEAPDQPIMPYAVLLQVHEPVVAQTTDYQLVNGLFQVNVHHPDLDGAIVLAHKVRNAFHMVALPLDSDDARALHCLAGAVHWAKGVGLGLGGTDCWVAYVEIEVLQTRKGRTAPSAAPAATDTGPPITLE